MQFLHSRKAWKIGRWPRTVCRPQDNSVLDVNSFASVSTDLFGSTHHILYTHTHILQHLHIYTHPTYIPHAYMISTQHIPHAHSHTHAQCIQTCALQETHTKLAHKTLALSELQQIVIDTSFI